MRVKKLDPRALIPSRQTSGSAGYDLAVLDWDSIGPGEFRRYPTGVAIALDPGTEGHIRARSSFTKKGLVICGTLDEDYRGEILLQVWNVGPDRVEIPSGGRIAQLVIHKIEQRPFEVVESLEDTARGAGGFGSTGT